MMDTARLCGNHNIFSPVVFDKIAGMSQFLLKQKLNHRDPESVFCTDGRSTMMLFYLQN